MKVEKAAPKKAKKDDLFKTEINFEEAIRAVSSEMDKKNAAEARISLLKDEIMEGLKSIKKTSIEIFVDGALCKIRIDHTEKLNIKRNET